ncbi:hypothetical protein CF326_g5807 [Tilletia indica]|nr:hypothetical protein CF326_g5807 [Tilletia indica]
MSSPSLAEYEAEYEQEPGLQASQAFSLTSSHASAGFSQSFTEEDSVTGNSQEADHDMADLDYEDLDFINDATQSSQELETPSLSQDLAGLSPAGSITASRIIRPGPGTYRDQADSTDDESLVDWNDDEVTAGPDRAKTPTPGISRKANAASTTPSSARTTAALGVAASVHAPQHPGGANHTSLTSAPAPETVRPTGGSPSLPASAAGTLPHQQSAPTAPSASRPSTPSTRPAPLDEAHAHGSSADAGDNRAAAEDDPHLGAENNPPFLSTQMVRPGHHLNGQSLWRLERGNHPDPDWTTVSQIAETMANPPNCTIRAVLPDWVQPAIPVHAFELYGAISDTILPRLSSLSCNQAFHIELMGGRRRCVQISFAEPEAMAAMRDLIIPVGAIEDHSGFVLDSWLYGEPLSTRYVAWQVRHPGTSPHAALRALQAATKRKPNLRLIEAWGINYHMGPPPAPKIPTNTLCSLFYVIPPRGGNHATPLTEEELRCVPGWLLGYSANFAGKPRSCRGCKDEVHLRNDFHTSEQCTNTTIPCAVCYDRDHTGATCPKPQRASAPATTTIPSLDPTNFPPPSDDDGDDDFTVLSSKRGTARTEQEYTPAGPSRTTAFPAPRRTTTANVVPVAGPSRPIIGARGRGRGRGQGRGAGPTRTTFRQANITPTGGISRPTGPPVPPSPQARKRTHTEAARA